MLHSKPALQLQPGDEALVTHSGGVDQRLHVVDVWPPLPDHAWFSVRFRDNAGKIVNLTFDVDDDVDIWLDESA